ncbi:MAG TPA: phosphoserine phosphatase SerB [Candidatus Methylopumilus sp.]
MKLLIQSSYSFESHLAEISEILNQVTASPYKLINDNAAIYDIRDDLSGDLKNQLDLKNIDFAILDNYKALNEFSLCVMDMDSTLISIECIDEIADMCGKKDDVALITKSAMMGEIDFSQSLIKRVSLLEGLGEEMLFKVIEERLKFNEGTQAWIKACRKNNVTTVLVSGGFDYFADYVKNKLGIDVAISNQLEIKDKKLTGKVLGRIVNDEVKAQTVRDFQSKLNIDRSKTIVIGDGANDLKMLAEAQYSIAYHAKPIVQEKARFKFNHSDFKGVLNLFKI